MRDWLGNRVGYRNRYVASEQLSDDNRKVEEKDGDSPHIVTPADIKHVGGCFNLNRAGRVADGRRTISSKASQLAHNYNAA